MKAIAVDYFDVLGNETDGYEVNNLAKYDEVEIPNNFTDDDLFNVFVSVGLIDIDKLEKAKEILQIEDCYPFFEFETETGCPFGRIEIVE